MDNKELIRKQPCEACGKPGPSDPAHIKTRGAGGSDEPHNLIALCRQHHAEQHKIGFNKMCQKFPRLKEVLKNKGWIFDESFKKWIHYKTLLK